MKPNVSAGFIFSVVIISEAFARVSSRGNRPPAPSRSRTPGKPAATDGTYIALNLTDEVHHYIVEYIAKDVTAFSLTDVVGNQRPTVKAKVGKLVYGDGCSGLTYYPNMNCSDLYMFYIYNAINSPFELRIYINLLYKGTKNHTHTANINNASYIYWNPHNVEMYPPNSTNYTEEKCSFTIETSFTGSFAYQVTGELKGDKPHNGLDGIGKVAQLNAKLFNDGEDTLMYNISGTLLHSVTCV
uniref:Putative da-p36 protein n=1 Tax=Rhipicephalus pulchellus TaxID=72859 RepID=L7LT85_RHIPC